MVFNLLNCFEFLRQVWCSCIQDCRPCFTGIEGPFSKPTLAETIQTLEFSCAVSALKEARRHTLFVPGFKSLRLMDSASLGFPSADLRASLGRNFWYELIISSHIGRNDSKILIEGSMKTCFPFSILPTMFYNCMCMHTSTIMNI